MTDRRITIDLLPIVVPLVGAITIIASVAGGLYPSALCGWI